VCSLRIQRLVPWHAERPNADDDNGRDADANAVLLDELAGNVV
jgi:hypothetical protein